MGNYTFNNADVKILANGEEIGRLPDDATFCFSDTGDYIPAPAPLFEGTISFLLGKKTQRKLRSLARRLAGGKREWKIFY